MMTIHPLHAGNGYEYLTRQVARGDEVRPRGESLTDYYNAHGNPPGRWVGTGAVEMGVSGAVDATQMRNLFGTGSHPNNEAQMLGRAFHRRRDWEEDPYLVAVQKAFADFAAENDRDPRAGGERDRIRWQVATEILRQNMDGAEPSEPEVGRYLASRQRTDREGVSGFDLVFTPPKSVSVLWGLADDDVREQISQAHARAWQDTLAWIEQEAALTRVGAGGLRQINTKGLTAAAFDHLDSRAGDPNLHTHVAVSAKVMGTDGKWRSLDARVLFSLTVAASERYNALVEEQLVARLGVQFEATARPNQKVPVREITGVGADLVELFSQRRRAITASYNELVAQYRATHGHEPPRNEQYRLAQEATLATRAAKEAGAPLSERVQGWRARAVRALGSEQALQARLDAVLARRPDAVAIEFNRDRLTQETAEQVLEALGRRRATWNEFNVLAEATRMVRDLPPVREGWWQVTEAAQAVTQAALGSSVQLTVPDEMSPPAELARADGESVYVPKGTTKYTSLRVLDAERDLLEAAQTRAGFAVTAEVFESAAADLQIDARMRLDSSQLAMARRFACDPAQLVVGIGPAGAGKTTAMRAFVAAVNAGGGRVVAVGPSAVSAQVLGDELGVSAETMHKLIVQHQRGRVPEHLQVDENTVLLVDEAGMAGTLELQEVLELAQANGASVRLLGDPNQLDAVGAGGALRMIANTVGAAELRDIYRFRTPGEDLAGLLLREGRASGLDFYIDEGRVHTGSREAALEELHAAWVEDTAAGLNSIMIAASNEDVTYLNERARMRRILDGQVTQDGVVLRDGTTAGVGDIIASRHNDRMLRHGNTDYVKNGDLWVVLDQRSDGSLVVKHRTHNTRTVLPAAYVRAHVQLGYATTVHRCQGMTVDVSRMLVDRSMTREHLYTGATRGRNTNHLYVVNEELLDTSLHHQARPDQAARAVLETVLGRSTLGEGAMATMADELEHASSLATLVPSYEDAYATVLDPEGVQQMSDAVLVAYGPDHAATITAEDTWPLLAALLYRHQRCGADLPELLRRHGDDLAQADSPAQLLRWRLGEPATAHPDPTLPVWITPPPADLPPQGHHPQPHAPLRGPAVDVVRLNELAYAYWASIPDSSWASHYLSDRRLEHTEHVVAPASWTGLVEHLRGHGVSDEDILAAGLATKARTGRLIDRFRDRIVVPIRNHHGELIAFTARANPHTADERTPKWLNPPATAAYDKSASLLGLDTSAAARLRAGARPVFVEGAFDVAAINALGNPDLVPLAPCGTALTTVQLDLVRSLCPGTMMPIFAFDADRAGQAAALRAWSHLTDAEANTATHAILPTGADPASVLTDYSPEHLAVGLDASQLLAEALIDQLLPEVDATLTTRIAALRAAAQITARLDQDAYTAVGDYLASRLAPHDEHSGLSRETVWAVLTEQRAYHRTSQPSTRSATENPAVAAWLRNRADLITERLNVLTARVANHPPVWAANLPPAPEPGTTERQDWDHHVRQIVAYRDRFQISSDTPLGPPRPESTPQGRARAHAHHALTALGATNTAPERSDRDRLAEAERSLRREQMQQHLDELHRAIDPLDPMHHHLTHPGPGHGPGLA